MAQLLFCFKYTAVVIFLKRLSYLIDQTIEFIGRLTSWITLILVILIVVDVFMRYFLDNSKMWMVELEWHFFSILFLLGASYTLLHDKHVRVDVFYEKFKPETQKKINKIGMLIFLIPWSILILSTSGDYVVNSFSFKESSSQPGGLPARYIIKSFIWLGFFLLLLQGISELIKLSFSQSNDPNRWNG